MSARVTAAGDGLDFSRVSVWFNDPGNWRGDNGLFIHIREHLVYTAIALVFAVAIALPLGLLIGHTGRGVLVIAGLANGLRAVPTLGFVVLLVVWISPKIHATQAVPGLVPRGGLPYVIPVEIVLILLAIPPILTNTYAGVQNVDPSVRDAARGMGMRESQIVRQVEFPIAMPLIMSGFRSATLQVIATATVAAYVPFLGGLGRLIVDGTGNLTDLRFGYTAMVCAGIMVALLAVLIDVILVGVQRLVVSRGIAERYSTRRARPSAVTAGVTEVAQAAA